MLVDGVNARQCGRHFARSRRHLRGDQGGAGTPHAPLRSSLSRQIWSA